MFPVKLEPAPLRNLPLKQVPLGVSLRNTFGKWCGTVLNRGTAQEAIGHINWGQEDRGFGGGLEGQHGEQKGQEGDRMSGGSDQGGAGSSGRLGLFSLIRLGAH